MKLQVLIVEDDEALRVLAESLVEEGGYEVRTAGTVLEARAPSTRKSFISFSPTSICRAKQLGESTWLPTPDPFDQACRLFIPRAPV